MDPLRRNWLPSPYICLPDELVREMPKYPPFLSLREFCIMTQVVPEDPREFPPVFVPKNVNLFKNIYNLIKKISVKNSEKKFVYYILSAKFIP